MTDKRPGGQGMIEYATIMGLVILAVIFGGPFLVNSIRGHFQVAADSSHDAVDEILVQATPLNNPPTVVCDCQPEAVRPFDPLAVDPPPLDALGNPILTLRQAAGDPPWVAKNCGGGGCGPCQREYQRSCIHNGMTCNPLHAAEYACVADPTCGSMLKDKCGDLVLYPQNVAPDTDFQHDPAVYHPNFGPGNKNNTNTDVLTGISPALPYCKNKDFPRDSLASVAAECPKNSTPASAAVFRANTTIAGGDNSKKLCPCYANTTPPQVKFGKVSCLAGEIRYIQTCNSINFAVELHDQPVAAASDQDYICVEDPACLPSCNTDPGSMTNADACPPPTPPDFFKSIIDRRIYMEAHAGVQFYNQLMAPFGGKETNAYVLNYRTVPTGACATDSCAYSCRLGATVDTNGAGCSAPCVCDATVCAPNQVCQCPCECPDAASWTPLDIDCGTAVNAAHCQEACYYGTKCVAGPDWHCTQDSTHFGGSCQQCACSGTPEATRCGNKVMETGTGCTAPGVTAAFCYYGTMCTVNGQSCTTDRNTAGGYCRTCACNWTDRITCGTPVKLSGSQCSTTERNTVCSYGTYCLNSNQECTKDRDTPGGACANACCPLPANQDPTVPCGQAVRQNNIAGCNTSVAASCYWGTYCPPPTRSWMPQTVCTISAFYPHGRCQ